MKKEQAKDGDQGSVFHWSFFTGSTQCIKSQNEIKDLVPSVSHSIKQAPSLANIEKSVNEGKVVIEELAQSDSQIEALEESLLGRKTEGDKHITEDEFKKVI